MPKTYPYDCPRCKTPGHIKGGPFGSIEFTCSKCGYFQSMSRQAQRKAMTPEERTANDRATEEHNRKVMEKLQRDVAAIRRE